MRNFLIALDDFFNSNTYYNEDTGETEIDYEQYNAILDKFDAHAG